jgi:predicted secreted protein
MKNTTLAMVAVLAAVVMLSAVLAVPMQQANAENRDGKDSKDGDGGNSIKIKQSNECEDTQPNSCTNEAGVGALQFFEVD